MRGPITACHDIHEAVPAKAGQCGYHHGIGKIDRNIRKMDRNIGKIDRSALHPLGAGSVNSTRGLGDFRDFN